MKLAEALILRADAQKRIEQLRQRINSNAQVQEGETPAEDPQVLIAEFERVTDELTRLIRQINATNVATQLDSGRTLVDALAERDVLKLKHNVYSGLAKAAAGQQMRYSLSEIRVRSTVNVAEIQTQADDLARRHRELDTQIQAANWLTDLID
ncbi:MAG: DIP1984 family protein [Caldilineaceae bacterium]|nr:DIP1984 family protein [Caldilineaceae bacterium]